MFRNFDSKLFRKLSKVFCVGLVFSFIINNNAFGIMIGSCPPLSGGNNWAVNAHPCPNGDIISWEVCPNNSGITAQTAALHCDGASLGSCPTWFNVKDDTEINFTVSSGHSCSTSGMSSGDLKICKQWCNCVSGKWECMGKLSSTFWDGTSYSTPFQKGATVRVRNTGAIDSGSIQGASCCYNELECTATSGSCSLNLCPVNSAVNSSLGVGCWCNTGYENPSGVEGGKVSINETCTAVSTPSCNPAGRSNPPASNCGCSN
ncbi:MAG: hypothetical protein N4A44_04770 [Alphaproteobacteria bacterium]|jgi:hypothetical protein|nr:hypothetical protein [Alphaproteobacteria bacterium]